MDVDMEEQISLETTDTNPKVKAKTKPKVLCSSNPPLKTESDKVLRICQAMEELKLTPKKFMVAFLTQSNTNIKIRRRLWGSAKGWDSTIEVVNAARDLICGSAAGRLYWNSYILSEAQKIVRKEAPPSGEYPNGAFHSSRKIDPTIFSEEEKFTRFQDMCQEHMPFLYQLLIYKLTGQSDPSTSSSSSPTDVTDQAAETESNSDKDELEEDPSPKSRQIKRSHMVATAICYMVSFIVNRRHNAFALSNSMILLACGISERINNFLHFIGLTTSRTTGFKAYQSLSTATRKALREKPCLFGDI
ncbi:hypothetical protein PGT21_024613 [Puccinia graminis f. sp. tritici]|uniref:Uncharacterized protein n=2 Tax=Puccinia graminis f. sp. tritici TaxID=56615 RepID=E3LAS7_PUCGT|nr:uncharacterized protein PGTG_19601 [Puccinia graminis f. sp. tritici CRL 75-36-700-3]KAA1094493.1 hypothetical protein PGT21_023162 [Puccinia graminis f. sp. tritici]EFP93652.2 hypothetical protein PGTG_19601 [Puccinia graminis f. sp. tritici CRL 75-36-700-3]KAA1108759.1 hypothetical protein PGT21_024613 [Puccinia graminis f. sp. tritici]KAA1122277.1 hypothetical protein PGTUg99_036061 [Puccinia graminis f. sp. tritici]KAA1129096.1 hypothetical protein PGTUg99_029029 [Puccinia graminis f. s